MNYRAYYNPTAYTKDLVQREGWYQWGKKDMELAHEMYLRTYKEPDFLERMNMKFREFIHSFLL